MNVDETGRHDAVASVDHGRRRRIGQTTDGGNAIAGDTHIGPQPGIAAAVHDPTIANQHVESSTAFVLLCRGRLRYKRDRERADRDEQSLHYGIVATGTACALPTALWLKLPATSWSPA